MPYSPRIVDAFRLAYELHKDQVRKGSDKSYITHLTSVAGIVGEYGGDEEQFIAALLHDAVEDQGGQATLARIRDMFGEKVADYVVGCSDADTIPKPPWRERKQRYLEQVADAFPEQKLIVAADKLHNARAIINDLRVSGDALWERFNGGRDATLWYCGAAVRALAKGWRHSLLTELEVTEEALQRLAAEVHQAGPEGSR